MIDFRAIRPIRGSANNGFEELCCQLAHAETLPEARFVRNGTPDGGVECYWVAADGRERGWQAKWFFEVGPKQWEQLDESVETALSKHPALVEYTVCLPIDLPDARVAGQQSLREKWDKRVAKWEAAAQAKGMAVRFGLWGEHELLQRLTLDVHVGRRWYWFRSVELSPTWFADRAAEAVAAAGPRYTPEVHVPLPIAAAFESLTFSAGFRESLLRHRRSVRTRYEDVTDRRTRPATGGLAAAITWLDGLMAQLLGCLTPQGGDATQVPPLGRLTELALQAGYAVDEVAHALARTPDDTPARPGGGRTRPHEYELHRLNQLRDALEELQGYLSDSVARLAETPALLLVGDAGTGKSHLLCDVTAARAAAGAPSLLFLGQQLGGAELWGLLLARLGLGCSRDELLGALDAAAEATGGRALVCIDAINEADGIRWEAELPAILEVVRRYPRVALVVSCRTTFERLCVRDGLVPGRLVRLVHRGFASQVNEAVRIFCRHYEIETLNTPPLATEFENPLFLKLYCAGLQRSRLRRPPAGHHGLSHVFAFFIDSVDSKLASRDALDYHPADRFVPKALDALADLMLSENSFEVPRAKAQAALHQLLPQPGGYSRSLLARLVAEGLLIDDTRWRGDREHVPVVRFAYERLADYLLARRLLDRHLDHSRPSTSFAAGTPLGELFSAEQGHRHSAGLQSMLCLLLPDRTGAELGRLLPPGLADSASYRAAFLESLPWRSGESMTDETEAYALTLLAAHSDQTRRHFRPDQVFDQLLLSAALPDHRLNAAWLHAYLLRLPMPERDRVWSTYLHRSHQHRPWAESGVVERLLRWGWPPDENDDPAVGFDDETVHLAGLTLGWFLTTPNRFIRDRATKALVSVFSPRPYLLVGLLSAFSTVDDLYVLERLHAVAYGVALRTRDREAVARLAQWVYGHVFASGRPPLNVLLRDYARGVVECALHLGCPVTVDAALIRPPYASEPPPEEVPAWDELARRYDQPDYWRLIESLTPGGGDFSRYILDSDDRGSGLQAWSNDPNPFGEYERARRLRVELPGPLASRLHAITFGNLFTAPASDTPTQPREEPDEADVWPEGHADPSPAPGNAEDTVDEAVDEFLSTLTQDEQVLVERYLGAQEAIQAAHTKAIELDRARGGDASHACRWILARVIELGWTPERFADFDRGIDTCGRSSHKAERVGKKYQWLAYYELAARVFDNRPVRHDMTDGTTRYEGPWQMWLRNTDPSLLCRRAHARTADRRTWWVPIDRPLRASVAISDPDWLRDLSDLPNPGTLFSVTDPATSTAWLPLRLSADWRESDAEIEARGGEYRRDVSFTLASVLVKRDDRDNFVHAAGACEWDGMDLSPGEFYRLFVGEYAWAPSFRQEIDEALADLSLPAGRGRSGVTTVSGIEIPVATTVGDYVQEGNVYDCSISETVSGYTPSLWLARRMSLSWSGRRFDFVDPSGRVVACDPAFHESGPPAFLVDAGAMNRLLGAHGLALVWLLIGEKLCLGDGLQHRPGPGRTIFRRIAWMDGPRVMQAAGVTVYQSEGTTCPLEWTP